ncbi:MAG: MazG-like family protein [Thermoanaerobacteraceae bacterium]|nr:MazG-like family protein [Thermoanaerobacteraceae bacterium]
MTYQDKVSIARNIHIIEELKAELVDSTAGVLKALAKDDQSNVIDSLTRTIISTYLLAKKLGIDFSRLDSQVIGKLKRTIKYTAKDEGIKDEMEMLLDYLADNQG